MRYLIFSDLHGNLEAVQALKKFLHRRKIDHFICLGDLVGYGASPNEVIQEVRELSPLTVIRGNHDKAICDQESLGSFNPIAAAAIHWTRANLSEENHHYLSQLPQGPMTVNGTITICHGAPFDEDYYIFGEFDAAEAFLHLKTSINFFGHTHFPYVYSESDHLVQGNYLTGDRKEIRLKQGTSYLINPGSVGQPRDRNTRAACAIYDSEKKRVSFHRMAYDILNAQNKIREAGLPSALSERLTMGI